MAFNSKFGSLSPSVQSAPVANVSSVSPPGAYDHPYRAQSQPCSLPTISPVNQSVTHQQSTTFPVTSFSNQSPQPPCSLPTSLSASKPPGQCSQPAVAPDAQTQQPGARSGFSFEIKNGEPYVVHLSQPAQAEDVDQIKIKDRGYIRHYMLEGKDQDAENLRRWSGEVKEKYWQQVTDNFANEIPASILDGVFLRLCESHPCISDSWSGHAHYRNMFRIPSRARKLKIRQVKGKVQELSDWMGDVEDPHQTWRDTLRAKTAVEDKRVPLVSRQDVLTSWIILKNGDPTVDLENDLLKRGREKWELLKECKLTYQISKEEHVTPDPYWEGFEQELAEDPEQSRLYDKVVREDPNGIQARLSRELEVLTETNRRLEYEKTRLQSECHQTEEDYGQAAEANVRLRQEIGRLDGYIATLEGLLCLQDTYGSAYHAATGEPQPPRRS